MDVLAKMMLLLIGIGIGYLIFVLTKWLAVKYNNWYFNDNHPINDEPNVNDLDFEAVEYLAGVIGDNVQTDYQLKVLARYELLKKEKHSLTKEGVYESIFEEFNNKEVVENTLPKDFTIDYNEYEDVYYPRYKGRYLDKARGHVHNWGDNDLCGEKCKEEYQAREIIKEYNAVNLGNGVTRTIK